MATPPEFDDYKRWVQRTRQVGMRIGEEGLEEAQYIPIQELRDYWDEGRVRRFLTDHNGHNLLGSATARTIVRHYLRIFSTLVFISNPSKPWIGYLESFVRKQQDDDHLPFDSKEYLIKLIHPDPARANAMEAFFLHQFLFSPIPLASPADDGEQTTRLHDGHLDDRAVLPMVFKRELSHSLDSAPAAQLCLLELSRSSGLTTKNQLVVAKIFPEAELEYEFHCERSVYFAMDRSFRGKPPFGQVLECYGSFVQSGRGVLLIEYANHGSLLEMFEENNPPYTWEEMMDLWEGLAKLFDGLAALHNLVNRSLGEVTGVHQDLQPSNIFVFSNDSAAKRQFSFKIGDFGLSRLMQSSRANDRTMPDSKGPIPYRAPELMHWSLDQEFLDPGVTTAADMWSMGCVLIETAVWSVCGERGRKEFRDNRNAETATKSAQACHGTFHDGNRVLAAVENVADILRPRLRVYDNITLRLCVWFCEKLLEGQEELRLPAGQAGHHMMHEIRRAQREAPQGLLGPAERLPALPSDPGNGEVSPVDSPNTTITGFGVPLHSEPLYAPANSPFLAAGIQVIPHPADWAEKGPENHIPNPTNGRSRPNSGIQPTVGHPEMKIRLPNQTYAKPGQARDNAASPSIPSDHRAPSPSSPRPPSTLNGPVPIQNPNPGTTTIISLVERRRSKKDSPNSLPQDLDDIPDLLARRDQVFLIDDSVSMAPFAKSVRETVEGLASVVKSVDPDGMELRFTSKPGTPYKGKHAADLLRIMKSHRWSNSECLMETALNVLMDSLVPSPDRGFGLRQKLSRTTKSSSKLGISVYILTNGVWSGGSSGGSSSSNAAAQDPPEMFKVDESVKTVVRRLQKAEKQRSYLMMQFICFGHDPAGKARLRYLDNQMKDVVDWDIIDRRRWDGPVRPMLIGALSEREDGFESDDSADKSCA